MAGVPRGSGAVFYGWLALATAAALHLAGAARATEVVTADVARAPTAEEISEATLLGSVAPDLDPAVLERALAALECASDPGIADAGVLAVIDYARPSTERRLWIFDRTQGSLLFHELVAHGSGSGEKRAAKRFSNTYGTLASSLGLFRAAETYEGRNGYSMRLDGLDPGVNDQARLRTIVLHGAEYVSESYVAEHGQLGVSQGCPAVEVSKAREMIDALKDGGALYASGKDAAWLEGELRRDCGTTPIEEGPLRCPDSLTVDQTLAGDLPQAWKGFGSTVERVSHPQSAVSLFDGDPTLASAVFPDQPGPPETLRWTLGPPASADGYFMVCHYSGTTFTVGRPLTKGVTACESEMVEQRMVGLTCR